MRTLLLDVAESNSIRPGTYVAQIPDAVTIMRRVAIWLLLGAGFLARVILWIAFGGESLRVGAPSR